ncbi:MAG: hypothetical protein AB7H48_05155 [Parachlamydiales bacterium]
MSNTVLSPDFAESFKTELTETTEETMKIAGVLKESDLSQYIPYGDGSLSEELFFRLQKTDQKKLAELIKENVINQNPKSYSPRRSKSSVISHDIAEELEKVIERAMDKVKAQKESDLCPYIPYRNKRLHHFTYGQLKKESPEDVLNLIQEHILDKPPQKLARKYRPRTPKEKVSAEDKKSEKTPKNSRSSFKLMLSPPQVQSAFHQPLEIQTLENLVPTTLLNLPRKKAQKLNTSLKKHLNQ